MIKCSKNMKLIVFFVSVLLGVLIGVKTYDVGISQTLLKFLILSVSSTFILIILSIIGNSQMRKYDLNDELVLDDDMEEYFEDLNKKYNSNIIIASIICVLLLIVICFAEFHMPIMPYVCSVFYFVWLFIYIFPIIDTIIKIVSMMIQYKRMC